MQLDFQRVGLRLAHAWQISRTDPTDVLEVAVIRLVSDDGLVGLGEAAPVLRYRETIETVEAFSRAVDLQAISFEQIPDSLHYLNRCSPGNSSAKCAFNVALLDGAAKRTGKPVHDLLGLGFKEKQHVTSFTIGIDRPSVIRQKVLAAKDFPILKMKVGVADDRQNLAVLREVAPTKTVRVDANEGWQTKERALEMIEWLAGDKHIEFVEQPMPASTPRRDWIWLKERSPLPIFADESYHLAEDVVLAAECFHGVNVKLVKAGGISAAFEALTAAHKAGLKTMLGCMIETSILISAAAHLAELCDYLDLDGNLLITNDPYAGITAENGVLSFSKAPEKVGLCVDRRT